MSPKTHMIIFDIFLFALLVCNLVYNAFVRRTIDSGCAAGAMRIYFILSWSLQIYMSIYIIYVIYDADG